MEVPLRLLYGDGVSLAFAPRIALPPAPASSLFRPWPFHALSRSHRLPCSDPSASPFPASASSPRMAFPPATLPSLLRPLRVAFPGLRVLSPHGLSSGHIAFPAPTPPASLFFRFRRPSVPAITCSGSSCFSSPSGPSCAPFWFVPLPAFGKRPDCLRMGLFCPPPAPKSINPSARKRRKYLEKRLQNPIL